MTEESVFTKIINRQVPADIRYEDDKFIVITSIQPVAPIHLLIIPKQPIEKLQDIPLSSHHFHAAMIELARKMAIKHGINDNFQLHLNCGKQVQQVQHLHLHLTGGWDHAMTAEEIDQQTAAHLADRD